MTIRTNRMAAAGIALALAALAQAPVTAAQRPKNQIQVFMLNTGVETRARGRCMFVENKAQRFFQIKVTHLTPASTYDVIVDGTRVDQISTKADGSGKVVHRARLKGHNATTLPYDPRGKKVEIAAGGTSTVVLDSDVPSTPGECDGEDGECDNVDETKISLTNTGVQVGATAQVEVRSMEGRIKLEIETHGMLPGSYDLFIGGVNVGVLVVGVDESGDLHFDTVNTCDDEGGDDMDILLTFDPTGQTIEIREQVTGVVLFSGSL